MTLSPDRLSEKMRRVQPSATIRMASAAREYTNRGIAVINLSVGEPNFGVPDPIVAAAHHALDRSLHRYPPVAGIIELRRRLHEKFRRDNHLEYPPEGIVISTGAKQAIFNFLAALLDPGDEVIVPVPYWTSYPEMVRALGGEPVFVPTLAERGFKLEPSALAAAIGPRTKAMLINSPNNPTGAVYSKEELTALAKALEGTDVFVCSDEIYEALSLGPATTAFASVSADAFQRTVTVNGFSKAYGVTGWRLGYAAGPKYLIKAMEELQGHSTSGANSIAQHGVMAAFDLPPAYFDGIRRRLTEQYKALRRGLKPLGDGIVPCEPAGAFYLLIDVRRFLGHREGVTNSLELALHLLEHQHIATVPGSGFGLEGFLRLSFAAPVTELEKAAEGLVQGLSALAK